MSSERRDVPPAGRHRLVVGIIVLVVFVPVAMIVWATRDRFDEPRSVSESGTSAIVTVASAGPSVAETSSVSVSVAETSSVAPSSVATTAPSFAVGFGERQIAVGADELRVLVADTSALRGQGLRAVESLDPYGGMLFVFESEAAVAFTMADTLIALSIGFYDSSGVRVGSLEMVPCRDGDDATCPLYAIDRPFRYALETASGLLPDGNLTFR